nr:S41 family peptidase [Mariniblastus fucicola]
MTGAFQNDDGKWNYRLKDHPELALLRIDRFGNGTAEELEKLSLLLDRTRPAGIILDLRAGGGALHDVVNVADKFLDAGRIGSTTIAEAETIHRSNDGCLFEDIPIVVLTSTTSSSSSAFLAAALQDRDRAVVVGEPTNGASYLRSQFDLNNGDKVIIPSGYIRRINGTKLFTLENPILITHNARRRMRDENFNRKSANMVFPNFVVFADRNTPELLAAVSKQPESKTHNDPILTNAVSVLRRMTGSTD